MTTVLIVDETHWATDLGVPYVRAKTEAERLAWKIAGELGLNMVTILPCGITGPGFVRNTPTIDFFEAIMLGAMRLGAPDTTFPVLDVRDVVRAHVLAAEHDCEGRFIASGDDIPTFRELAGIVSSIDPTVRPALMTVPHMMGWVVPIIDWINHRVLGSPRVATPEMVHTFNGMYSKPSNQRIKRVLGWKQQYSLEQTIRATMQAIRSHRARR